MNSTMRVVLGIGVVVVAVVLLIVLKDNGGDNSSDTARRPRRTAATEPAKPITTIVVDQNGKPVGGIAEISPTTRAKRSASRWNPPSPTRSTCTATTS